MGAFLSLFSTVVYDNFKDNDKAEASATLLYHDMEQAVSSMEMVEDYNKEHGMNSVWNYDHINLYGKHGDLLIDLKDEIEDLKNLLIFYDNLNMLKNTRKDYYALKSEDTHSFKTKQKYFYIEYSNKLNILLEGYEENKNGVKDSLEKIKDISSFKDKK